MRLDELQAEIYSICDDDCVAKPDMKTELEQVLVCLLRRMTDMEMAEVLAEFSQNYHPIYD